MSNMIGIATAALAATGLSLGRSFRRWADAAWPERIVSGGVILVTTDLDSGDSDADP
jgi:hypothetical protein